MRRTTYCGNVTAEFVDQQVVLKGWVQKKRNLGNLVFIDLRDRHGIVQLVVNPETPEAVRNRT